jgi:hypothetical protein
MENKVRKLTPYGFAKWAHVHKAKAPYRPGKPPQYSIDVCFLESDPEWKTWAGEIMATIKAMPSQTDKKTGAVLPKQIPIKREFDKEENPTGRFYVTFKTGEKYPPGVFDRFGREIPKSVAVGNESRVQVSYVAVPFSEFGGGLALYLNAVQVWELVEYGGHSAASHGFKVESAPVDDTGYAGDNAPPPTDDPWANIP